MSYPVPYVQPVTLTEGKVITIGGVVSPSAKKLTIALVKDRDILHDTPFVLEFRFEQSVTVRNTLEGSWGAEERHGGFPLGRGQPFEVRIEVKNHEYKIFVNNAHFTDYKHRVPKESVRNLYVNGEATINKVLVPESFGHDQYNPNPQYNPNQQYNPNPYNPSANQPYNPNPQSNPYSSQPYNTPNQQYNPYPQTGAVTSPPYNPNQQFGGPQNLAVPLTMPLSNFHPGSKLVINGVPTGGQRFSLYLLCGPNVDHDDVALVYDVRFNFGNQHNKSVCNSRTSGSWGPEHDAGNEFPFAPNRDFEMLVKVKEDSIKIIVDDEKICSFPHRIRPERITFLNVQGDIRLTSVRV